MAVPALAFVVGAVLGGLVIGLGGSGSPATDSSTVTVTPSASGSTPAGPDAAVVVPAACNEAAEAVARAVTLLRDAAASVRDFDPERLDDSLDELEDLDPRLRDLADQCAAVSVGPTLGSSPTPS